MKTVFADADYLIALLNPKDQLHPKAGKVSRALGPARLVTSEMALTELLAFYSDAGPNLRKAAAGAVLQLCSNSNVTVVPQTSSQFHEALALYRRREDKDWSLTDCASFQIMQARNITETLAHDEHFEQAGFKALLGDGK